MKNSYLTVEEYICSQPKEVQTILNEIRHLIRTTVPKAKEQIAYQMPAYKLNKKPLIYFAAYKSHIGLYATPSGHAEFAEELSEYKQGKGSVQFPLTKPIPYDLIQRIVKFRAAAL